MAIANALLKDIYKCHTISRLMRQELHHFMLLKMTEKLKHFKLMKIIYRMKLIKIFR